MMIALDGPAASGKGTLAKRIAAHYGLPHLDTGLLYRALAAKVLKENIPFEAEMAITREAENLDIHEFTPSQLKNNQIAQGASIVATIPSVREALLQVQRNFAYQPKGAVLDGRDVGTVVVPNADVKIFITANPQTRARRRFEELQSLKIDTTYEVVLADIEKRDQRDQNRAVAPLVQAQDALLLDTSELDIEAAFQKALSLIESRIQHSA